MEYVTTAGSALTLDDPLDWLDARLEALHFSEAERARMIAWERRRIAQEERPDVPEEAPR